MKYVASLKFRTVGGRDEYRIRRKGKKGIRGEDDNAKRGRLKQSTRTPKKKLLLYRKRRKY